MAPKKKQEKMSLGDFLGDQSLGSWADEMETQPLPSAPTGYGSNRGGPGGRDGGERRAFTGPAMWERSASGMGSSDFGGGRGASFGADRPRYDREQLPLPDKPPYTAHLGNLAFDVTQDDVMGFLAPCEPTNVRIVEDKIDRKPKGFGYVEFATLEGLKKALTMTGTSFMGRDIRLSVAEPPKEREGPSRDFSNWERRGPLPEMPSQGRQPSFRGNRNFDDASDAGSERGGTRKGFFEGDGKVRDFSNWERKGPLSPALGAGGAMRDDGRAREGAPRLDRRQSPSWGEGRSEAGSRPPRREFSERPPPVERVPTAAEQDNQWRTGMKPDASPAPTPDVSTPSSPAAQAPKERPRLNLAKRTVSQAPTANEEGNSAADSKASPFGAARPIDTAARDRELAEKRELALRQKIEADAKAKEEKAAKEAESRAARAARADAGQTQQDQPPQSTTETPQASGGRRPSRQQNGPNRPGQQHSKENGEKAEKEKPNFNLLRRAEGEDDGEDDVPDANANGTIVGDKETKPQEIVREVVKDGEAQSGEPTATAMEEDGWSTVAAKPKNNRRGGARALAS